MKYAYLLLLIFSLTLSYNVNGQSTVNETLYFNLDDHSLTNSSEQLLTNFIANLSGFSESSLQVIGHTDQQGSVDYNLQLSKKRAEAVKKFIVDLGYSSTDVELNFRGESDLLINKRDLESLQKNRRVSLIAKTYNYSSIEDFVTQLEPDAADEYVIDQNFEKELLLSQGTKAKIPAHAFCNMDGSSLVNDNVSVTFKEAFDYTHMVDNRLLTQTADQILETGGMIYIEATQNGIPVKLQEGKEIELLFPQQKSKGGMELFTGVDGEGGITWEETGESISEEKEELFVQVDMTPITSFVFEYEDNIVIPDEIMPSFPKVLHKPQPPARIKYSEEKYQELYQKYEKTLASYYIKMEQRPEQISAWHEEVKRRKELLIAHKRTSISTYVKKWMEFQIEKINEKSKTISHHKLVGALETFLQRKVGDGQYDYLKHRNKMFGGALNDVLDHYDIPNYDYSDAVMGDYCFKIYPAINEVSRSIQDEKIEMGYVDLDVSRYVVRTSNLGWINCDRFMRYQEEELMNFEFADNSEESQYYLVFKDIKSLISPRRINGKVIFYGVPKGQDVRLIGLGEKNAELFLAYQDITFSDDTKVNMNYAKTQLKELRDILEDI